MRIDGRAPDEIRPVKFTRNFMKFAEGSCLIEMGYTRVICSATVEEKVPPFLSEARSGWVTAEYGMLPRSTLERNPRETFKGGRTHEIQRLIGRALRAVTDLSLLGERTVLIDCDVLQADGGTRTASITGAFVALVDALRKLQKEGRVERFPVRDYVGAISVGIVKGKVLLDLCYQEDSRAEVDMNVVMSGEGKLIEVQGTAEGRPFDYHELEVMLKWAEKGIGKLIDRERELLGALGK